MSTIVTDTLQGKTSATSITLPTTTNIGATPLVSASATSMTIRGEGSAVTNIQQGLIKSWMRVNMNASTQDFDDSFNQSSVSDGGAGESTCNFTNNMANSDWVGLCTVGSSNRFIVNNAPNTTRLKMECYAVSTTTANDTTDAHGAVFGDLA